MAFKIKGKEMYPIYVFTMCCWSVRCKCKAWKACTLQTEKPLPHNLCSFISSLYVCPASSASTECIFSIYDLVSSKIRKSLDAEKAENLVKIKNTDCADLKNITIKIYLSCSIYSYLLFKSFKFHCCSFCLIKKNTVNCTNILLLFIFLLLSRFFKGKVKSCLYGGFYCFYSSGLFQKNQGRFFLVIFFTTILLQGEACKK